LSVTHIDPTSGFLARNDPPKTKEKTLSFKYFEQNH